MSASKRRLRRRQCEGKRPYPTRKDAEDAIEFLLKSGKKRHGGWIQAYACPFGRHYHIGHKKRGYRT